VVVGADLAINEFDQPYTGEAMAGRLSGECHGSRFALRHSGQRRLEEFRGLQR
jgi:hypothetical protein